MRSSGLLRPVFSLGVFAVALTLGSCDTLQQQNDFRIAALAPPSGFTRTDEAGNTLGTADPDDWRIAPIYGPAATTSIDVRPLYPNPTNGSAVTLVINVRTGGVVGGLRVDGYREREGQLPARFTLAFEADARPGLYAITLIPAQEPAFTLGGGLRRIVVYDGQNDVVTYGDLMLQ